MSKQCGADENRVNKNLLPLLTALGAFLTNLPTLIRYFTSEAQACLKRGGRGGSYPPRFVRIRRRHRAAAARRITTCPLRIFDPWCIAGTLFLKFCIFDPFYTNFNYNALHHYTEFSILKLTFDPGLEAC